MRALTHVGAGGAADLTAWLYHRVPPPQTGALAEMLAHVLGGCRLAVLAPQRRGAAFEVDVEAHVREGIGVGRFRFIE
jgi:hypothetical protein